MELAEIAYPRDSESSIVFSDDGSTKKNCPCSRTWVLVVHNDFLQVDGYERKGNDVDLENLRRVWKHERQCKFAELANCTRAQIIGTLSSGEKLSQLFHPRNSSDPGGSMSEPPEVFLLFVLSHGESGGIILTDHFKPKHTEQKIFVLTLETYETCDVWNSLMDVHLLKSCVKVLFFAPCRGLKPELKHNPSNTKFEEAAGTPASGLLVSSNKPNYNDFIIFYATVERTFSNRNELQGTWFVQSICSVLDSLDESEDILLFFTKVQNNMCQRTNIDCFKENVGQTPQLHFFASKEIQFCASHANFVSLNSNDCVTKPDCRPQENTEIICLHAKDAKQSNFSSKLIKADRAIFYDWGQERFRYHRGTALIFHEDPHICQAFSIGESFKNLDYDVKIFSTGKIMTEIGRRSLKKKLKYDGSLVLFILAQLEDTTEGFTLKMGEKYILLSQIVDELSVEKCNHLLGKPKLIFVIDEGTKQDNSRQTPEVESLQFSNSNAGTCLFVGTRTCPDESLTDKLTSMLALEELKNGQLCLQFALANLIRQISSSDDDGNEQSIKPQLISTLPVLVDFPPLWKPYKPFMSTTNNRIIITAGITISVIIFTLLLSLIARSGGDKAYFPNSFSQVHISDNCTVGFSDGNSDQVDAFSYNRSTWNALSSRCLKDWRAEHTMEFVSLSHSKAGVVESAVDHVKSAAPFEKRSMKLLILFGYSTPGDLQQTLTFVSALITIISKELLAQSCIDIFHRVESFKQLNGIEVLPFWEIVEKEGLQSILNFTSQLVELHSAVIDKICDHVNHSSIIKYHNLSIAFLKLDDSTKLYFIPRIISTCYKKNLIVKNLYQYIASMGKFACEGLNLIFLLMRSDFKIAHSSEPLHLRKISSKINKELCKEVVKNIKKLHFSQLQTAFETFEEKCIDPKELQDEVFNFFPKLVEDIYKGNSKNGTRLAKFIWSVMGDRYERITIGCRNSRYLMFQMRKYQKLNSFHALVLFTYMSMNDYFDLKDDCYDAMRYAPEIVLEFMFDLPNNSSIYTNSTYLFNAINDTNAILMEHGRSDDANVSYPYQVLFLGFALHSLREQALQSDLRTSQLFIETEKKFKEMYEPLYDEVAKYFFFPQHSRCNSVVAPIADENFEAYLYKVVFQRAFAQFGLTIADSMISRLDGIFAKNRFSLRNMHIFCNLTIYLYDELQSSKSALYCEEAFAVYLFLENYNDLPIGNKSSTEVAKAHNKCSSTFENVADLVQGQLDYFLQTWNDANLRPEQLKWHNKFQLSSAWLLPKLVQHVINNNNSQNLLQLVDLFSVLINQSYSEPFGICPGLNKLLQQMISKPISFGWALKEKIHQIMSYTYDKYFNENLFTRSTSYQTFNSECSEAGYVYSKYYDYFYRNHGE